MKPDNHLKLLYGIAIVLFVLLCWASYEFVMFMKGVL